MRNFVLGFLLAAALAAIGYYRYKLVPEPDPCRVCSTGTRCAVGLCVVASTPAAPVSKKRPGRTARAIGSSPPVAAVTTPQNTTASASSDTNSPPPPPEPVPPAEPPPPPPPPPPTLKPEERKLIAVGDKLTGTEVINLAEAGSGDHELSQDEIDAVFRPRQSRIISCIDDARGEAQLDAQVTVAFRIQRSGKISGVRIEAPAYLINHGLLACVRGIVQSLPFPASTKAQIVTYPFALR